MSILVECKLNFEACSEISVFFQKLFSYDHIHVMYFIFSSTIVLIGACPVSITPFVANPLISIICPLYYTMLIYIILYTSKCITETSRSCKASITSKSYAPLIKKLKISFCFIEQISVGVLTIALHWLLDIYSCMGYNTSSFCCKVFLVDSVPISVL